LGVPDLRGDDPRRPRAPLPRAAAQPLRRRRRDRRRADVVLHLPAPRESPTGCRLAFPSRTTRRTASGASRIITNTRRAWTATMNVVFAPLPTATASTA